MQKNILISLPIYISIVLIRSLMYFSYWVFSNFAIVVIYFVIMLFYCFFIGKSFLRDSGRRRNNFFSVLPVGVFVVILGVILHVNSIGTPWISYMLNPFYELFDCYIDTNNGIIYSLIFFATEMLIPVLLILGIKAKGKKRAKQNKD